MTILLSGKNYLNTSYDRQCAHLIAKLASVASAPDNNGDALWQAERKRSRRQEWLCQEQDIRERGSAGELASDDEEDARNAEGADLDGWVPVMGISKLAPSLAQTQNIRVTAMPENTETERKFDVRRIVRDRTGSLW